MYTVIRQLDIFAAIPEPYILAECEAVRDILFCGSQAECDIFASDYAIANGYPLSEEIDGCWVYWQEIESANESVYVLNV